MVFNNKRNFSLLGSGGVFDLEYKYLGAKENLYFKPKIVPVYVKKDLMSYFWIFYFVITKVFFELNFSIYLTHFGASRFYKVLNICVIIHRNIQYLIKIGLISDENSKTLLNKLNEHSDLMNKLIYDNNSDFYIKTDIGLYVIRYFYEITKYIYTLGILILHLNILIGNLEK